MKLDGFILDLFSNHYLPFLKFDFESSSQCSACASYPMILWKFAFGGVASNLISNILMFWMDLI